jgi:protein-tyrosine phosphatase
VIIDAGGLPVAGGGHVRRGRLLRVAGGLVGPDDLPRLSDAGVRAYVDLRGAAEDRTVVRHWAAHAGVDYRWLPIDVAGGGDILRAIHDAADAGDAAREMARFYRHVLDTHGGELAAAVGVIAEGTPVAFGCLAGKDRTGIVAALVQTLLGAAEDDVARAYVVSAPDLEPLITLMREHYGMTEADVARPGTAVALGVEDATIRNALRHVREAHGGVDAYLIAHGLSPEAPATLRADLVAVGAAQR